MLTGNISKQMWECKSLVRCIRYSRFKKTADDILASEIDFHKNTEQRNVHDSRLDCNGQTNGTMESENSVLKYMMSSLNI